MSSGRGHSIIGGKRFDCIPGGEWYEHINGSPKDDAIFLISSDEPTLRKLGFAMKHGRTPDGKSVVLETSKQSDA